MDKALLVVLKKATLLVLEENTQKRQNKNSERQLSRMEGFHGVKETTHIGRGSLVKNTHPSKVVLHLIGKPFIHRKSG